jgi:tetratricopeptide (TPR) repeat protein
MSRPSAITTEVYYLLKNLAERQVLPPYYDRPGVVATRYDIGLVQYATGDYSKALDSYLTGLKLAEELNDVADIRHLLPDIASAYVAQEDLTNALVYSQRNLKLAQKGGNTGEIAVALRSVGLIHGRLRNYTQAVDYFRQSLALATNLKDKKLRRLLLDDIEGARRSQQKVVDLP